MIVSRQLETLMKTSRVLKHLEYYLEIARDMG